MPKIVSNFVVGFCLAFNPATLGTMAIREEMSRRLMEGMQGPSFRGIPVKAVPVRVFQVYIRESSSILAPIPDWITFAIFLTWWIYHERKQ